MTVDITHQANNLTEMIQYTIWKKYNIKYYSLLTLTNSVLKGIVAGIKITTVKIKHFYFFSFFFIKSVLIIIQYS